MRLSAVLSNVVFMTALVSCNLKYGSVKEKVYEKNLRSAFIEDFKTVSFCRCLEYGNNYRLNLKNDDLSCAFPDYLYSEIAFIDSLASIEKSRIKADSVARIGKVAEGMEGKRVVDICLEFYQNKQLDALAKARYKIIEKQNKELYRN